MSTNNLQEEFSIINNNNEENIEFEIIYKPRKKYKNKTKIFDNKFVNKNKDKCKIIYKNIEYELKGYFEDIDNNSKNKEEISVILRIDKNIRDISYMFSYCKDLLLIRFIPNINNSENNTLILNDIDELDLSDDDEPNDEMYDEKEENGLYKYLEDELISSSISTVTNKDTTNVFLTNNVNVKGNLKVSLECCDFYNITDLSYMFNECESLISLPDISKWNTSNVTNMNNMFYGCKSLISLPDISKWNISKVTNISYMLYLCKSLLSLSDISKWNTSNVKEMNNLLYGCESLISLPDISKWNTSNVSDMSYMFYGCKSLISLPDISKWKISNVFNINNMFKECVSLISLPDISKWNISNTTGIDSMSEGCINCLNIISEFIKNNNCKLI